MFSSKNRDILNKQYQENFKKSSVSLNTYPKLTQNANPFGIKENLPVKIKQFVPPLKDTKFKLYKPVFYNYSVMS